MKINKYLMLFQLVAFIGFAQDKPLSSYVKSQFVNEEGVVQFAEFDETSKLNFENRSDLLKKFLKTSENTSFVKLDSQTDKIGFLHETYQQYYNNIPVEFGIYKTHLKNGIISSMNGEYYPMLEINTTPTISAIKAVAIAHQNAKDENFTVSSVDEMAYKGTKPALVIFPKMENINVQNRLAYKLDVNVEKQFYRAAVYVDAHTGEIIFENSKIHKIDDPATGTTLYNGVQSFKAQNIRFNRHRLRQSTYGNGIETFNATSGVQNATDILSTSTTFNNINNVAVQVHWGTERAYQYFMEKHARNSFDNNGALIKSYITPQTANASAYWTGSVMHYSMGYGSTINPVASLDVVGHEFSHAVVDYSANLIYSYESGAIDESFADIFGEMVENYGQSTNDWLCGAAFVQNGLRSMSNPKSKGQPDTYLGQYWQTSPSDNFGVHTNSGVQNKWFYLLAVGGSGTTDYNYNYSVNGIGIQKAAEIAYRTLTLFLTPNSKYHYVCEVSIYAAGQLFGVGSTEQMACADAWKAVGLMQQPTDYYPPTKPLNLVVTNATQYDVSLSWDASTDNVNVLGYTILLNGAAKKTTATTSATVSQLSLQNNINYEFTVIAFDAAGNYSQVSDIQFILFDTIAPTAPTNLTSSNTTETTTDLNWTPSTDNFGIAEYLIYKDGSHIDTVNSNSPSYNSYPVSGLTPNTTYSFKVKAIDINGNESNFSNIVNVTTAMQCTGGNGNLTLTVNFSNTSNLNSYFYFWEITDYVTLTVVADGYYFSPPVNSTLIESIPIGNGTYFFDFFDISSPAAVQNFELAGSSQVIIPSTGLTNNMYGSNPFCVTGSANRVASTSIIVSNSSTKPSGIIYPNPVSDKLYFKDLDDENKTFSIVDIMGKTVIKGIFDSDNSVDVCKLQSGIYILKILGKEETENYKFIKK